MTDEGKSRSRSSGAIALLVLHSVAMGLLFIMISTVGHAFADHYKTIGYATTPSFNIVNQLADFLSRYAIAFVVVVGVDVLIVRWILNNRLQWLSAYSHICLVAVVCSMFIAVTWMINPIVANARGGGGGAVPANPAVASAR